MLGHVTGVHTSLVILCNLGHVFGRVCIILGIRMSQVLIEKEALQSA